MTAEELFRLPDDHCRHALVRGELQRMAAAGFRHGAVIMNVAGPLSQHVKAHGLGVVCGAETGFVLARAPDTVLAPDVAFVRQERIAASVFRRLSGRVRRISRWRSRRPAIPAAK